MAFERAHCQHCGQHLPRLALAKLDWVCRGCGSRLRKPRWIDLTLLVVTVIAFIALMLISVIFYTYLFYDVLDIDSGFGPGLSVLVTIGAGFAVYAYVYPYFSFHRIKEARPHCVKCMYPVEADAEACPECGEVVPWNHDLPAQWTTIRFGEAKCHRCSTPVPRIAKYEKGGEWVCRGCGATLIQPPHLYAIANSIQAVVMFISLMVSGLLLTIFMSQLVPQVHGLIWFVLGAAIGLILVMALHWAVFPFVSPYIVKDARVHCGECGIAVPDGMSRCPSCTRAVRYANYAD